MSSSAYAGAATGVAPARVLLIADGARKARGPLRALRSAISDLDTEETSDPEALALPYDLVMIDYDAFSPGGREAILQKLAALRRETPVLLLAGHLSRAEFAQLFGSLRLSNVIAHHGDVTSDELIVTAHKLLRGDIFGLEKYFAFGVEQRVMTVTRSSEKANVLDEAERFAAATGANPRLVRLFCEVAEEFVSNAVYDAPVDAQGRSRYLHVPRAVEVVLEPSEVVEVKFCSDGRRLGISTTDPFGSLGRDRLLEYLSRCLRRGADQVDTKPGGAGLGFYYIFESLTHFVVNIAPGRRTEMIGLIDAQGSYRDFASRSKSFNVFISK